MIKEQGRRKTGVRVLLDLGEEAQNHLDDSKSENRHIVTEITASNIDGKT
jgi:hypothetical protein